MPIFQRPILAAFLLAALAIPAAQADELRSTLQDQQSVAVTIYNEDLALVKDQRKVQLGSGQNALAFRDVSAGMRPETALLRSLSSPGKLSVIEQNFDFDLLTPGKLLEKYVGKTVSVVRTNPATGNDSTEQALVLSANEGVVLKIGNRIETGMPGRIVYPDVPENLRDRPTLVMSLNNGGAAQQEVELSYLTGGLAWKADYVAELNTADDKLDLSGWVTLTNTSGASYNNAKLQLVAGDVNRVQDEMRYADRREKAMLAMAAPAASMAEESLMEYHLYTLDRPTTIAENQTKQVSLLTASGVPTRKELLLRGANYYYGSSYGDLGQKMKVAVFVEFDNKEASHLGMPLPKGVIRVYKKDGAGNAQFVGEDRIDHTPKNEKVRLKLGESFDVTADKKQTDFKRLPNPAKGNSMFESAFEIVLKNAKKESVVVKVQEPIPGDWKVISENHKHSKAASNTAVWQVNVPAEGSAKLAYRVQVKY
ncbi:MAG: DUF4139 domain-containing protein [Gammaproteobacteria bacterium]|nr:DUF4139 domain-containing protein [Gammaproteobacteria bacterium]MBU1967867.1 DUF4139 domain-containing protein [Gammaproteobacteria bacterium]